MNLDLRIIAAVASNGIIGKWGDIPWHIPDDLKRFQKLTSGFPVIMGRRTFESIYRRLGGLLPHRKNVVLTRNQEFDAQGVSVVHYFDDALEESARFNARINHSENVAYVIGGKEIYRLALESPLTKIMKLTEIHRNFDGDTYFPDFDRNEWNESARINRDYTNKRGEEISYSFVTYER